MLRIPLVGPDFALPTTTKVREGSLPEYLHQSNVATKADLAAIDAVTITQVAAMIAQSRADIIAQVEAMLENIGNPGRVFVQDIATTTVDIDHGLGRSVVSVSVYSLDFQIQWESFDVFPLSDNRVRLSFDDPTSFIALIL